MPRRTLQRLPRRPHLRAEAQTVAAALPVRTAAAAAAAMRMMEAGAAPTRAVGAVGAAALGPEERRRKRSMPLLSDLLSFTSREFVILGKELPSKPSLPVILGKELPSKPSLPMLVQCWRRFNQPAVAACRLRPPPATTVVLRVCLPYKRARQARQGWGAQAAPRPRPLNSATAAHGPILRLRLQGRAPPRPGCCIAPAFSGSSRRPKPWRGVPAAGRASAVDRRSKPLPGSFFTRRPPRPSAPTASP